MSNQRKSHDNPFLKILEILNYYKSIAIVSVFKINNSLAKKLLALIIPKNCHFYKKINKCDDDSSIKSHFDYLRILLQNDTFSIISFKEELTDL